MFAAAVDRSSRQSPPCTADVRQAQSAYHCFRHRFCFLCAFSLTLTEMLRRLGRRVPAESCDPAHGLFSLQCECVRAGLEEILSWMLQCSRHVYAQPQGLPRGPAPAAAWWFPRHLPGPCAARTPAQQPLAASGGASPCAYHVERDLEPGATGGCVGGCTHTVTHGSVAILLSFKRLRPSPKDGLQILLRPIMAVLCIWDWY